SPSDLIWPLFVHDGDAAIDDAEVDDAASTGRDTDGTDADDTDLDDTDADGAAVDGDAADDETNGADAADGEAADGDESTVGDAPSFPVTIEHKFGSTSIDAEPERVVSIGFAEHDGLLALGVEPVGVRDWYGNQPFGTWPWAQDELGDLTPDLLPSAALNFEQIAALEPDVIIGVNSGMTESDYETLSAIAPTVAQPGTVDDFGVPWRDQLRLAAVATGRTAEADQVIADVEALYASVREAHPEFEGTEIAVAYAFAGDVGGFGSDDNRSQIMTELGFVVPQEFDDLAGDSFFFELSQEEVATLDRDVVVWIMSDQTSYLAVQQMPLRPTLTAFAEGREIASDPLLSGAFSHASPLSIEFVLDELVPELALAIDGDPATSVPSAELLDPDVVAGELSEDEAVAAEAWSEVFDSTTGFDVKATHLADAESLRTTLDAYATAGESLGGISVAPQVVQIDGATAIITYDIEFGGTTAYTAIEGELSFVDGEWLVSRDEFCDFAATARVPCGT
ncbi:MAG: iron-siderophore ABC transporter substrate-binding protein, partial [Actinomycetota bacterium]